MRFVSLISFIIRQFLPNPFIPLGENATVINLLFGGLLVPITYLMVGLIYDKGSNPAEGSLKFFVVYMISTAVTYIVCKVYPMIILMSLIVLVYLILYIYIAVKYRDTLR